MKGDWRHPRIDAVPNQGLKTKPLSVKIRSFDANDCLDFAGGLAVPVPALSDTVDQIAASGVRKRTYISKKLALVLVAAAWQRFLVLKLSPLADPVRPQRLEFG